MVVSHKCVLDIYYLLKANAHCHRYAPETEKNRACKIAIFLENMAADRNVNNFTKTIVHHPAFRETIKAILSGSNTRPSSSVCPATT